MEPSIQYAQTKDGVSIAYWTFGEGPALVQMPSTAMSPSQRAWQTPDGRRWFEGLANERMLVRYDNRGFGNSQPDVADFSLDAMLLDIHAVVDRLGLERFTLMGYLYSGPQAIAYAARHPERVSHLILWCTAAQSPDLWPSQRQRAMEALRETDLDLYIETLAHTAFGWSGAEQGRRYAQALRESMTPEAMRALAGGPPDDVRKLLPQVKSPTLVLYRRELPLPGLDTARDLAATIPNARLAIVDGDSAVPYLGDMDAVLQAIDEFLSEGEEQAAASPPASSGLATILFTDMESSTALTQRLGDARFMELLRTHDAVIRDALKNHNGRDVKHTGDGIMASFVSVSGAVDCAITIQRAFTTQNEQNPDIPIRVRIGLTAGEPVMEHQDLFGAAVQLARRICDCAEPSVILVANVIREICMGKDFLFSDIGEVVPKGFEEPVRLYEVRWREEG